MNKHEIRSRDSYNKKAENYDKTFDGKFTVKFKKKMCDDVKVKAGDTVADIACGNGLLLSMLREKVNFTGYGVDISEKMVEQAGKLNEDMQFYVAGCDKLPFENETIGVMTVCAAFHHFPEVERFAKEAKRTIRKDGKLYIAEVYLPMILRWLCNPFVKYSKSGDVKFYAPDEIAELFKRNGFNVNKIGIDGRVQIFELQKM